MTACERKRLRTVVIECDIAYILKNKYALSPVVCVMQICRHRLPVMKSEKQRYRSKNPYRSSSHYNTERHTIFPNYFDIANL